MNPATNVTCSSCGARLVPLAAPVGPETPPAESEVPEWLAQLASTPSKPSGREPVEPVPATESSGADDWMSQLRGALEQPAEPEPTGQAAPAEEAPDWLRDLTAPPAGAPEFDLAARLRGAAEPPPKTTPATPPPAEIEVPDWLAQLAPSPTQKPEPPATPPSQAEVPDWLAQLAPTPTQKPEPPATPPPSQAEVPDWLVPKPAQGPEPPVPAPPLFTEPEMPEWLAQLAPTPAKEPERPPPAQALPTEIPDWLTQLAPTPAKGSEPPAAVPPLPSEAQAPEWLAQLAPSAPPGAELEMPEWLKGLGVEASVPPAPPRAPFVGEEAPEEMPAWLKDISGPQVAPTTRPAAPEAPAGTPEPVKEPEPPTVAPDQAAGAFVEPSSPSGDELPAWPKELEPAGASTAQPSASFETPAPTAPTSAPGEGQLEEALLPPWLEALKPVELETPAVPQEEGPAETEGILAGLRGTLPAAAIAWQPLGAGVSTRPQITPDDLARASALQELIGRGVTSPVRREGEGKAQRLWSDTLRLFIFVIIAVAVVTPLWPGMNLGLVGAPGLEGAANAMYESIDKLSPDAAVLVAFDYDATQSPEMDAQARAVVRHLFARQAQVYFTSLYPAGPAAAQVVISETGQLISSTAPIKIVNLGYVPGQATAVAFINTTPYSTVIELAASPDTLRWWVEQLATRPDAPPLLSGVSASAEPMSQPYLQSQQVKGMLVGIRDAVAYEMKLGALKQEQELQKVAPLESIVTANLALIALIVLGGLVQLVSGSESTSGNGRRQT